jgi:hypothetical protein
MRASKGQEQKEPAHTEMGFLIACVRQRYDPGARLPDPADVNWNRWTELAMRHRVLPIVYTQLAGAAAVPDSARGKLKDLYFSNAARNMARANEMKRLAGACETQKLPVMFLRGPVLASTLYGDMLLRQFSDLDLLIQGRDVPRISSALVSEGYRPHFKLDAVQEQALIRYRTERCFIRGEDQSTVDLHWRLLPSYFSFETADTALWSRAATANVEGANVRTLGDEDMFLFLCAHGAKHGWDQLALLCDLAEMVRGRPGLDWDAILGRAQKAGKQRMIQVGLLLVDELLGVPVPDPVRKVADDRVARQLVDELKARLVGGVGVQEGGGVRKWRIAWRMIEGCRARMAYAADLMVVPTGIECERMTLPRPLFFLYYLLRLGRMAGKVFSRGSAPRVS